MDDVKIILYILAAVAYFLFSQWRKAFKTPDDEREEEPRPQPKRVQSQQPPKPVTSFEDILRELQPKMEQGKAVVERRIENSREALPPLVTAEERVPKYKNYEGEVNRALSWEKAAEAREIKRRSGDRSQPVFKANNRESEPQTSRYAKMLRNPATVRDAVVLSEIFNRRYS